MNVYVNIDIHFKPRRVAHQLLALQRYICLPARQPMLWHTLKQLGVELGLAGEDKISGVNTKNPQRSRLVSYCASSSASREKKSESWNHCGAPARCVSADTWGRGASSGNAEVLGAGSSIYNNPTVSPTCQPLVPTELPAGEGAAVAEYGLFLYKQHRLGPRRARLCVQTRHTLRTLRCFHKQLIRALLTATRPGSPANGALLICPTDAPPCTRKPQPVSSSLLLRALSCLRRFVAMNLEEERK